MARINTVTLLGWLSLASLGFGAACAHADGDDSGVSTEPNGTVNPGGTDNPNAAATDPNVSAATVTDGRLSTRIDPYACIDMPDDPNGRAPTAVHLLRCDQSLAQRVLHNGNQQLTNVLGNACLTAAAIDANTTVGSVALAPCAANNNAQSWTFANGRWRTGDGNACLQLVDGQTNDNVTLQVAACNDTDDTQLWDYTAPYSSAVVDPLAAETTVAGRCGAHIYVSKASLDANTATALAAALPDLEVAVRTAILQDCNLMFAAASDVPSDRAALRVVLTSGTSDITYAANGKDVGIPAGYLVQQIAANDPGMGLGTLHQTIASYYVPANSTEATWIRQGLWWYARIRGAGYPTTSRSKAGGYAAGGVSAGFFFDWMDHTYPGVVLAMVTQMQLNDHPITETFFQVQTGQTLAALWSAYTATF